MFAQNLRHHRIIQFLTEQELAQRCGINAETIINLENENQYPDMETIKKLAEALHIRVSDFLASRNTSLVFEHGKFCNPF